jgi:cytosine/adenosine deaminase-related metal-dependent hydrolase
MIFSGSKLVTCGPRGTIVENGAIAISKGYILATGSKDKIVKRFSSHRVIPLRNTVLMPGLVNLHSHLELPPLTTSVHAKSFPDWLVNLIRAKKYLNITDYRSATRMNIQSLIQTGTTTVGEICTHGVSPALLKQSGLRSVVFKELIDMVPNSSKFRVQSSYFPHSELLHDGLSPHAPYTVSEPLLRSINRHSQQNGIRIAMHIAESREELRLLQRKKNGLEELYRIAGWDLDRAPVGSSSFEYLKRIGFLSPRLLAVHAVQVTDKDIELIRRSKVSIAHCPRSNRETGVGKMALRKLLDAGIIVGLGTDSLASSPTLSLWDEMRYAHQIHRRNGVSAEEIFRLATMGGAKALDMDKDIGSLEPGKKADIIAVPLPEKDTGNIYSDLLRDTKSCIMTMVNGKILFQASGRVS